MTPVTIVGNWKMNLTPSEAAMLSTEIREAIPDDTVASVVVCPPFVALPAVSAAFEGCRIAVGAQNIHHEEAGAFTGEVSAVMIREFCDYVIVGHSERRAEAGESDELISRKVSSAVAAELTPILCVGESADVRSDGQAETYVSRQLLAGLASVDDSSSLIVAYEPVWAIGTGAAATPDIAQQMMVVLRTTLKRQYGPQATSIPLLYGGSVTADSIGDIVAQDDIDGALVGGASLSAESFSAVVRNAAAVAR